MQTIGLVANLYNEAVALPGWIETALSFFDDVRVYHTGPNGKESDDGTMDLLRKWKIPFEMSSINDGFGAVRTRAVRYSPCDYVVLLDADERFYRFAPMLEVSGQPTPDEVVGAILQEYDNRDNVLPSNFENLYKLGMDLKVEVTGIVDHGQFLRDVIESNRPDVVMTIRRHWHDFSWTKPTQSWARLPDYQWRILRNDPLIQWDSNVKMHEQLRGFDPEKVYHPHATYGPFFDHYHLAVKRMAPDARRKAVAVYDALHKGEAVPE